MTDLFPERKRVVMLIGVYRNDWGDPRFNADVVPVVAGVLDENVWQHETDDSITARWAECKQPFDPEGVTYEWREVWVTLDPKGLRAPFEVKEIDATIEPPRTA